MNASSPTDAARMAGAHGVVKPVIILGAPRSGTSWLGRCLSYHPALAYKNEPNHLWRYGHAYRSHDVLTAEDAAPGVREFIRRRFGAFLHESGAGRLLEKTPANCLRVPFILEVFPDARLVHIIRDGRDVALSAVGQWQGGSYRNESIGDLSMRRRMEALMDNGKTILTVTGRFNRGDYALREIPAYLPRWGRFVGRKVLPNRNFIWGPQFPGIKSVRKSLSMLETTAIQWDWCVRSAIGHGRRLGPDQYFEFRYEDLVQSPAEHLRKILEFAELDPDLVDAEALTAEMRTRSPLRDRSAYPQGELGKVMAHIGPTLAYLGYDLNEG